MEDSRYWAERLRKLADQLDPPTTPDPEPFVVRVRLRLDGHIAKEETFTMPCIGDGVFNHFGHTGKRLHNLEGVATRDEWYSLEVQRVRSM